MDSKKQVINEDEIDLKELFLILWAKRIFIIVFTLIGTCLSIVYIYLKTPIYEIKANLKIGKINNKIIEKLDSVKNKLDIIYSKDNLEKNAQSYVSSIKKVKGSKELLEIKIESISNAEAIKELNNLVDLLKKEHDKKIKDYISINKNKLNLLEEELNKLSLEKNIILKDIKEKEKLSYKFLKTNPAMAAIYIININELNKSLFEIKDKIMNYKDRIYDSKISLLQENFEETNLFSNIVKNDYSIKPKKPLIITITFISGFILSIFIVLLMSFIKTNRENK